MRIINLLFFICLSTVFFGQSKHKKDFKMIYETVITYSFKDNPREITIKATTLNNDILKRNYAGLATPLKNGIYIGNITLDSSWKPFLNQADSMKLNLTSYEISRFKIPGFTIHFSELNKTSEGINVSLSNILFSKNRAIVEVGYTCGPLCGEGRIYFLEKKNKKWQVISFLLTWIS
jgi:hypothetical protein